ncbi:hypothetical protein RC083_21875 [Pseudoalteromonas haloplanktis]|uniref:Uncharacterized protein n=1 Tax=Pseudoalteromonas haloplanktis TaxID=228 RepID=A0ABU1BKS5_PSEHA|nr:hypothetical protein [Pseudoalteromonas haloplanktis]MDQ9094212.1 hypothetical protein [Pseudoalteromonas haloplanktis]
MTLELKISIAALLLTYIGLWVALWRAQSATKQANATFLSALQASRAFYPNIALQASVVKKPQKLNDPFTISINTINGTEKPIIFRNIKVTLMECDSGGKEITLHGTQEFLSSFKTVESAKSFCDELSLNWQSSPRLKVKIRAIVQLAGEKQTVEEESQTLWLS